MGRAKGRKVKVDRHNPIAATESPARLHAARKAAAKPFLAKLASSDAKERAESVSAIGAMLLEDKDFKKLLLKEDAIRLLLDRLTDDSLDVRVEASGALRNLCLDENDADDMCDELYKRTILTPIKAILEALPSNFGQDKSAHGRLAVRLLENAIALLLAFCETSETILHGMNQTLPDLGLHLVALLQTSVPASTHILALQCLMTLTDDNPHAASQLISDESYLRCLMEEADSSDLQQAALSCATLQNVYAIQADASLSGAPDLLFRTYAKAVQAEEWNDILTLEAETQSALLDTVEVALEGLAKLASTDEDDSDEDSRMQDDTTTNRTLFLRLIPLATPVARLATPLESASASEYPGKLRSVHLLALDMLHNLAWTIVASGSLSNAPDWQNTAPDLWRWASSTLPKWLQLGEEMADSAFSLLYGIAKSLRGRVSATLQDVNSLIHLYNATLNAAVQAKIVGLIGCLGQAQGQVDLNKAVGTFLVTLVASYPRSDAECVLEALDALFDIYADASFDYDLPVFVAGDFANHLEKCIPRVRQLKASLSKKRTPALWYKADETLDNLVAFIDYKRSERA
jgi:hypothetical protein